MQIINNTPKLNTQNAKLALDLAIGLKFGNTGQICVAANRIFVHKNI